MHFRSTNRYAYAHIRQDINNYSIMFSSAPLLCCVLVYLCRLFGKSCTRPSHLETSAHYTNCAVDRRDVSTDPNGNLHACQSFLTVVIEAEILAAFASIHKLTSLDVEFTKSAEERVYRSQHRVNLNASRNWL